MDPLTAAVNDVDTPQRRKEKTSKVQSRRTGGVIGLPTGFRIVVRNLPDCFVNKSQFLDQLEGLFSNKSGKPEFRFIHLIPGKVSSRTATAVLEFSTEKAALSFVRVVDGATFIAIPREDPNAPEKKEEEATATPSDSTNTEENTSEQRDVETALAEEDIEEPEECICSCQFALNRRRYSPAKPTKAVVNTFKDDPEFIAFKAFLDRKPEKLPSAEVQLEKQQQDPANGSSEPIQSALLKFLVEKNRKKKKNRQQRKQRRKVSGAAAAGGDGTATADNKNKNKNNNKNRNRIRGRRKKREGGNQGEGGGADGDKKKNNRRRNKPRKPRYPKNNNNNNNNTGGGGGQGGAPTTTVT